MAGAFQTSRDIFENPIWQNVVEFRLFFLIYGNACFKDDVRIGNINLKRGQWIRSYRNLQTDLEYLENRSIKKYSLSTIKRAIDSLVKQERMKILECELGTLFEVLNYNKYQGLDNYKNDIENAERTESEHQRYTDRTPTKHRQNNNKKDKKGEEGEQLEECNKSLTEFEKTIEDYKIMRKSLKKPMTDRAVELMLSKLDKLSKGDESIKIKILEQSIENSWLGIFELKQPQVNNYYSNNQQPQPTKGLMDLSDL